MHIFYANVNMSDGQTFFMWAKVMGIWWVYYRFSGLKTMGALVVSFTPTDTWHNQCSGASLWGTGFGFRSSIFQRFLFLCHYRASTYIDLSKGSIRPFRKEREVFRHVACENVVLILYERSSTHACIQGQCHLMLSTPSWRSDPLKSAWRKNAVKDFDTEPRPWKENPSALSLNRSLAGIFSLLFVDIHQKISQLTELDDVYLPGMCNFM